MSAAARLDQLARGRVCIVGDLLLDRFTWGRAERLAPEAPVPVVVDERTSHRASGAALVALTVRCLGGEAHLIGVVGDDADGRRTRELVEAGGVRTTFVADGSRPTSRKTRIYAAGQQLLRVDREVTTPIPEPVAEQVVAAAVGAVAAGADALVLSDYAKGTCSPATVVALIDAARDAGVPVVVDPKGPGPERYTGASIVTPNSRELRDLSAHIGGDGAGPADAARRIREAGRFEWVLATRGAEGMTLVGESEVHTVAAVAPPTVRDEAGAGDAVAATMALGLGTGLSAIESARLAAVVAAVAIGRVEDKSFSVDDVVALSSPPVGART